MTFIHNECLINMPKSVPKSISKSAIKTKAAPKPKLKTLIIVESPTKIKSISKFLSKQFIVESSKGHLIDLPKSKLGIDIKDNFQPTYITIRGKGKTLEALKRVAKKTQLILLATDPDREGEAISWHLERVLSKQNNNIKRIVFNEITKEAVLESIKNPTSIDIEKVNAQQARRLLDRLVGYSISPILQEKFGSKRFSAGRVQSVALKIICKREEEINEFISQEYWEFFSSFYNNKSTAKQQTNDQECFFKLSKIENDKVNVTSKQEAYALADEVKNSKFIVSEIKQVLKKIKPPPPYTTSKLQQDASTRLNFRARKTMVVAQNLYEGIDIHKETVGLITYMRTDSTRISQQGLNMARDYIKNNFSSKYLPDKPNIYHSAKQTQDAHEAIRPTDVSKTPDSIKSFLTPDQYKLYKLIWSKFVASQMTHGEDSTQNYVVLDTNKKYEFRYNITDQLFLGFRKVFSFLASKEKTNIPSFKQGDSILLHEMQKEQKFTQPPPRYTEASLIKYLEESGVGRPATYVPTINTLDMRSYIERKGRQIKPTNLGMLVNAALIVYFKNIVDVHFTVQMEEKLDEIASGSLTWQTMLKDFFDPFQKVLDYASVNMESKHDVVRVPLEEKCPQCETGMLYKKLGKNGYFIGCDQFVNGCRYSSSIPLGDCPLCEGKVVAKKSKQKGRKFYGCSEYPNNECSFMMLDPPASKTCSKCNAIMSQKVRKTGIILTCQNKNCAYVTEEKTQE